MNVPSVHFCGGGDGECDGGGGGREGVAAYTITLLLDKVGEGFCVRIRITGALFGFELFATSVLIQ